MEFPHWLASGGLGGLAAVVAWGVLLLLKAREDRKPKEKQQHDMLDDIIDSEHKSYLHASARWVECEQDRDKLRAMLSEKTIQAYHYRTMIENFLIDYPHHGDWWAQRLQAMREKSSG